MTGPARGASILIVDDEPEVVSILAEILADDAHRVETAYNGLAALDKLRDGTYDLIISDLRMPHLDGPGLYREVARRHPQMIRRMIFVTGDTLGPESAEFLRRSAAPTFGKPFEPDDVRRVIDQVLRAR
jgi:DNA-binding NtrC family response regulator